ncbi:hypothetical protein ACFX15_035188 [Malus domestica]
MAPTIGRWDTTMIHQAIRDVKVEDIEIADPTTEIIEDSSRKAKEKIVTRKRKRTFVAKDVMELDKRSKIDEAPRCSTIDEAQQQFDKLYSEEYLKLNPDYQTHIYGIDTTITDEMFNQFEKCTGMEQMRDIEKLKEEKELNKKKISDMDAEIQQLRLKNAETSGKVNLLLNEIGILKNKL